jgi:hypothetical protein
MTYAKKVDANQAEIVSVLRDTGASVLVLSRVGQGCPDLAVGFRGFTYFLEVKSENGKLTPAEKSFFDSWKGRAAIVRSPDDALRAIGAIE